MSEIESIDKNSGTCKVKINGEIKEGKINGDTCDVQMRFKLFNISSLLDLDSLKLKDIINIGN